MPTSDKFKEDDAYDGPWKTVDMEEELVVVRNTGDSIGLAQDKRARQIIWLPIRFVENPPSIGTVVTELRIASWLARKRGTDHHLTRGEIMPAIMENDWRNEPLADLAESETIVLSVAFVNKIANGQTNIKTLGELSDYLTGGGDFSEIPNFKDSITIARMAMTRLGSEREMENYPTDFHGRQQQPAETADDDVDDETTTAAVDDDETADEGVVDPVDEDEDAEPPSSTELLERLKALEKQVNQMSADHQHYIMIKNKRQDVAKSKARLDELKEDVKSARKRLETEVESLDDLIAKQADPQMMLPMTDDDDDSADTDADIADDETTTTAVAADETDGDEAPESTSAEEGDSEPEDGGWTASNWRNAPVSVLGLTDNQEEATHKAGFMMLGRLYEGIEAGSKKVQKRVKDKFNKWFDKQPFGPDDDEQAAGDDGERLEPQDDVDPITPGVEGSPKTVQLSADVPDYEEDHGLQEDREFAVIRLLGEAPVIRSLGGAEVVLYDESQYDVIETW